MGFIRRITNFAGGLWELLRIGWQYRLGGGRRYWEWRRDTAFGSHAMRVKHGPGALSNSERRRAVIRFGMWVFRMKRMR